jgi:hypothetical protein
LAGTVAVALIALPMVERIFTTSSIMGLYRQFVYESQLSWLCRHFHSSILKVEARVDANALQSIQFIACLIAVYIRCSDYLLVTFRLAFPSRISLTPFDCLSSFSAFLQHVCCCPCFVLATAPPIL